MSFKWLGNHSLLWNVTFRSSLKFHNFNSGLFKTMDILRDKDTVIELVEKELQNDCVKKEDIQWSQKEVFQNLISKLFNYSKASLCQCKAENFISSISSLNFACEWHRKMYYDLIDFFREKNDIEGISMVEKMYNYEIVLENIDLITQAHEAWKKGKISSSFSIFSDLYDRADLRFRKEILTTLQGLIFYSIAKKGKAAVRDVIHCATKFSQDKNNLCLLVCVWYSLFTSDIYEDQCLADGILNENTYFQKNLKRYIPWLGFLFLQNDEVTNYQRLIETALRFNIDDSVGLLLRNLFNYYYQSGYVSGCSAVYNCCKDLNVTLTHNQLYKFHTLKSSHSRTNTLEISLPEEIKYKF